MSRASRIGSVLAALVLATVVAPAADAQIAWQQQDQLLSPEGLNGGQAVVAGDGTGAAIAAWVETDAAGRRLKVAHRTPGTAFTISSETVASLGPAGSFDNIRVALAPTGRAVIAWHEQFGPLSRVLAYERAPAGTFSTKLLEWSNGSVPRVAIDRDGNLLVNWIAPQSGTISVLSYYKPVVGPATAITNISGTDAVDQTHHDVAFDGEGHALAVWSGTPSGGTTNLIRGASKPKILGFNETTTVSAAGRSAFMPSVAIDASRNATIVWWYSTPSLTVGSATRPAASPFGPQTFVPGSEIGGSVGTDFYPPQVAIDANGTALAVWEQGTATQWSPHWSAKPAGGTFAAAAPLGPVGVEPPKPRVAVDAAGNAVAAWLHDDGASATVQAAFRPGGGTFGAGVAISGAGDIESFPGLAMGGDREAAAAWARSDGANQRVEADFSALPSAPPIPTPPPPPPPPRPGPPPAGRIVTAEAFERGSAAVLSAEFAGPVARLEWDVAGSPDGVVGRVVDGGLQTSVRFRAPAGRSFTATVRAVGPDGTVRTTARAFTGARTLVNDLADEVRRGLDKASSPGVFAVGEASVLTGKSDRCGAVTMVSGQQAMSGCMTPVEALGDIPAAERGVLDPLARTLGLDGARTDAMQMAARLTDGFVARGEALLNDTFPVRPDPGAALAAFPQVKTLTSSAAAMPVGGLEIDPQQGFRLTIDPKKAKIPIGSLPKLPKLPSVGGFKLVGDVDVDLDKQVAIIKAQLQMPPWLKKSGIDIQSSVTLRATPEDILVDDVTIGPIDVNVGALQVDDLQLKYTDGPKLWEGTGKACVVSGICLSMSPPGGGLRIRDGRLEYAGLTLTFPTPGIVLWSGVNLEQIGAAFGLDPTRFIGRARIGVAQVLAIDGSIVLAFPSAAAPFILRRDEVGGGFPPQFYGRAHTRTTVGTNAEAFLRLPKLGEVRLATAHFLYEFPGYIAFGGSVNAKIFVVEVRGGIEGEMDIAEGLYNLHGSVEACVNFIKPLCAGSVGNISRGRGGSGGAGACLKLGPVSVGGGVQWQRISEPFIWPLDGCKWSRFRVQVRSAAARAAQAGGPYVVDVEAGEPSRAIRLDGSGGAPLVRVRGPGGQVLVESGPDGFDRSTSGVVRIGRVQDAGSAFTVVGLQDAPAGRYAIEPMDGSAPVARVSTADDPPDASARGTVRRGPGLSRVLDYDVAPRPGQVVSFWEIAGSGGGVEIGRTSGGRGSLRFTPAPGIGERRIEARFELNGLPAERRVVARFTPPSVRLARPSVVRVTRRGSALRVAWTPVSGAERYEVAVTGTAGAQRFVSTRRASLTVPRVARTVAGRVTVRAMAPMREGRVARARFARAAKRPSALGSLKRCRVRGKRVACR